MMQNEAPKAPAKSSMTTAPGEEMYTLARTMVDETYNSTVQSINTGFALAAALAWNDSVKVIIQKFIKSNTSIAQMHLVYALVVTLLSAVVFVLTKRFVKPSIKKAQVAPVLLR
jgi:hypothetical protein